MRPAAAIQAFLQLAEALGQGISLGIPFLSAATLIACGVAQGSFGLRDSGVGSGFEGQGGGGGQQV